MRFNLTQLRAFLAAADSLNFTLAADRVHVAQPTFSATIRNLEEAVGAKLFERNSRKVRLTPMGVQFVPLAARVIAEAERVQAEMTDYVTLRKGSVRFSALPALYARSLRKALSEYQAAWPDVRLELLDLPSARALEQIRREQLDMAIVAQVGIEKDLDSLRLCDMQIVAVLPRGHALAGNDTIEWRALLKERVIRLQGTTPMVDHIDLELLKVGMRFAPEFGVEHLSTAAGLIGAGVGVGVMGDLTAATLAHEDFVVRDLVRPRIARPISLVRLAGRELSPAAMHFHDMVVRHWSGPRLPGKAAGTRRKARLP